MRPVSRCNLVELTTVYTRRGAMTRVLSAANVSLWSPLVSLTRCVSLTRKVLHASVSEIALKFDAVFWCVMLKPWLKPKPTLHGLLFLFLSYRSNVTPHVRSGYIAHFEKNELRLFSNFIHFKEQTLKIWKDFDRNWGLNGHFKVRKHAWKWNSKMWEISPQSWVLAFLHHYSSLQKNQSQQTKTNFWKKNIWPE